MGRERREKESRQEFAPLWLQAEPSVSAFVFSSVSGFHDAEDLVRQIARELARSFQQYDPNRLFVAWALGMAQPRVIDFGRRNQLDQRVFSAEILDQLGQTIAKQSGERDVRREALDQCPKVFPDRSRRLLDLWNVEELKPRRTAILTGFTAGSVRVLLMRVRSAVAECIHRRLDTEHA